MRTITIDGTDYQASYKGITARMYREQFHSDLIVDLDNAQTKINESIKKMVENGDEFNPENTPMLVVKCVGEKTLTQLLWASIQGEMTLNKKGFIDYQSFIDNTENYQELIGKAIEVYEMMIYSNIPTVKSEDTEVKKKESLTTAKS